MSPGGVHSHQHQIAALAAILADAGLPVAVHAFLDGRDTPPKSARRLSEAIPEGHRRHGASASPRSSGRYYAMDRDKRWDRVEKAYRALTAAEGEHADDALAAVEAAYARGETDEFVLPTVIGDYRGHAGRRRAAVRQFPRRPHPRDRRRAARPGLRPVSPATSAIDFAAAVGLTEYSERAEPFPGRRCSRPRTCSDTLGRGASPTPG